MHPKQKHCQQLLETLVSIVTKLNDDLDANKTIEKLMMKAVGQREISAQ